MTTKDRIVEILRRELVATQVEVEDESALHAGHPGAAAGGGHYRVTVISPRFEGKNLIARHRMVYNALAAEMGQTIHALVLTALIPGEPRPEE